MYQSIQGSEEVTETSSGSDSVLWLYAIFSKATATALALTTLSSLVLTIRDTSFDSVIAMVHLVLRIYSLIFMVIAFICEMEWLEQIRHSAVFQNWIFRGLFYSYLGLFSFVEYANFQIDKSQFSWVIEFIALVVFSSGVCYTLLVSESDVNLPLHSGR
jgi:hypothetical protein